MSAPAVALMLILVVGGVGGGGQERRTAALNKPGGMATAENVPVIEPAVDCRRGAICGDRSVVHRTALCAGADPIVERLGIIDRFGRNIVCVTKSYCDLHQFSRCLSVIVDMEFEVPRENGHLSYFSIPQAAAEKLTFELGLRNSAAGNISAFNLMAVGKLALADAVESSREDADYRSGNSSNRSIVLLDCVSEHDRDAVSGAIVIVGLLAVAIAAVGWKN